MTKGQHHLLDRLSIEVKFLPSLWSTSGGNVQRRETTQEEAKQSAWEWHTPVLRSYICLWQRPVLPAFHVAHWLGVAKDTRSPQQSFLQTLAETGRIGVRDVLGVALRRISFIRQSPASCRSGPVNAATRYNAARHCLPRFYSTTGSSRSGTYVPLTMNVNALQTTSATAREKKL